MIDLIGQTIGDYQIEAPSGAGPIGQLFRARHLRLGRPAALRVLDPRVTALPDFQARFFETLRHTVALRHERIVEIFDFGTHFSLYYIAMEWVAGNSLRAELDRRGRAGWPLAVALSIAEQAAAGLAYAHGQGVIHGALAPTNLLLRRDGAGAAKAYALKIGDFGLARLLSAEALREPAYLSPEQFRGLELDGRSDIYSLGAVLYELVTGAPPFRATTVAALAEQHLRAEPAPPRLARPQLPAELEAILLRCLAKQPAERFADAGALAEALREAGRSLPAPPDDPLLSDLLGVAPPSPPPRGGEIELQLGQEQLDLMPGQAASVPIRLINAGPAADEIAVSVEGMPGAWLRRKEPPIRLAPGAETLVALSVAVPRVPESLAGDYSVTVLARSTTEPARAGSAAMRWRVLPYEAASVAIAPDTAVGRTEAPYQVTLHNEGNATTSYLLRAADDAQALQYSFSQNQASLAPGERATLTLTVHAPPRWLGSELPRHFHVWAENSGEPTEPAGAQFIQRALIPIWAPLALSLLLFLAVLFWRVLPAIRVAGDPTAAVPTAVVPTLLPTEEPTPTAEPGAPNVALFSAEPQVVAPGEVVVVAWDVQNAERVWIDQFGDVPPQGQREHRPEQTTDYRLVASGGGYEAVRIERVSILAPTATPTEAPTPTAEPGAPNVALFSAEPQVVAPGEVVVVAWDVQNAERVQIDQFGDVPPQGRREHRPEQTTDYRLVASGGGYEAVRIERVSILAPTIAPTVAPTNTPPLIATPLPTAAPTSTPASSPTPINLLDLAPSARWSTDTAGRVRFGRPASNAERGGWADFANNVTLEDEQQHSTALYTFPPSTPPDDAAPEGDAPFIEGQFDLGQIQAGQRFLADIGFAQGSPNPGVEVRISLDEEIIYETQKQPDGQLHAISIDLSRFAGRTGRLDIRVSASDGAAPDGIYWVEPRVVAAGQ